MNESEITNGKAVVGGSFRAPAHFMLTEGVKILLARQLASSQDHENYFSSHISKLPITSSARGLKSNSYQLASIAYRLIHQVFEIRQVKRECTGPVITISVGGRCTLKKGPRIPSEVAFS